MKHIYLCTKQFFYSDEVNSGYCTYGIILKNNPQIFIDDVSLDEAFVLNMVEKLNKYQVSPVHLHDVAEDLMH